MKRNIYLDYAATTPVDDEALKAAIPYFKKKFHNPSSAHVLGQGIGVILEGLRGACSEAIGCEGDEIYYNSGGTEGINQAFACAISTGRKHIVVSSIEHDAVLACAEQYAKRGFEVDYVKPTSLGTITPDALKSVVKSDTALVAIMAVNNIVGSIQPIKELAAVAHEAGALFFVDAVQAVNAIDIDVKDWGADIMAVSGHKFYAPKGVGFLYVRRGVKLGTLIFGGRQEIEFRGGTPNVPGIVAMCVAIEKVHENRALYNAHIKEVSDAFKSELKFGAEVVCQNKIADISSVVFGDGINGGRLAVALSVAGVYCSVGSACSAGSATPPKTLVEMGVAHPDSSVRFSFGRQTTVEQAIKAARVVNATVKRLLAL